MVTGAVFEPNPLLGSMSLTPFTVIVAKETAGAAAAGAAAFFGLVADFAAAGGVVCPAAEAANVANRMTANAVGAQKSAVENRRFTYSS